LRDALKESEALFFFLKKILAVSFMLGFSVKVETYTASADDKLLTIFSVCSLAVMHTS
jgi:hypothetical protein